MDPAPTLYDDWVDCDTTDLIPPVSSAVLADGHSLRVSDPHAPPGAAIDLLADNPRPPNCVALQGEAGVYRVRVGDYRIVDEVFDRLLVVQVVRIGHRREVYR
jgi:mRNA-degrading endonuclease RelE of RelBE toxin-antitoxin system